MSQGSSLQLLHRARSRFTQREIAEHVGKDTKTVRRWEKGETPCPSMLEPALRAMLEHDTPATSEAQVGHFRFIDLFAGIGGIRLGFEAHGGECVFTSEWNEFSKKTYVDNFGDHHPFVGDIVPFAAESVPSHDVLLAGFPCQPFSIAGVSKKNSLGRPHGFECTTQGTLFFDVARIIAKKQPAAFVLENVKNLLSHDKGNTFAVILQTLRNELKYDVHYRIIDGQHFTPQHRERIVIVGFREKTGFSWDDLRLPTEGPRLASILHKTDGSEPALPWDGERFFDHEKCKVQSKYTLTPNLWAYLQAYAEKHRAAGNGFGFGMAYPDSVTRTLSARYHKDGSEILVYQGKGKRPRRLTPRECARLMGFPDTYRIPVSDTQAYRQFGNSVVMPVMKEVARIMVPHVQTLVAEERDGTPTTLPLFA
ncbi:DNA (cytosine-5-)-methyltransferase [Burkholderia pseudomallei]|uniref:Cytosine-specific methyltransferase n=1 Tax=Burkholderia pseudomallei TaxID=28450 RepID=A0AAX0UI92_BURPE|nr:DNA (cytosine-5-)-methyltransferase [Burkholderia pseudomallei]MBF3441996.1 DNA (cytosine-5-)-methyltransferase [Burkholderia pseudomallei]MBF3466569.1 DNA (cytosine-5-)-methyltransferase [Burkholderia pseudomallei]MBF3871127.1 DNA (cytosine-5-)-methyltransferase [Burkholderia pseudomallei]MBF3911919.1 DNA (cytosine-5-)-methyltransferase [Burkholderia pseudomallei]MBF4055942.1 DNA (cytosine-5-)-methyltransferase [Burkholderia pseudomallei]